MSLRPSKRSAKERDIINVASEGWQWPAEELPPSVEEVFADEALSPEGNRIIEDKKWRARACAAANLQRAFDGLASKLESTYERPAPSVADRRKQDEEALIAFANFLEQTAPGRLIHIGDRLAMLAQALRDTNKGRRPPMFVPTPPLANRADPGMIWIARVPVTRAIETLCGGDYSRERAAEWAVQEYPDLKKLITESGSTRSKSVEKAIVSWCNDFARGDVKNAEAAELYAIGMGKLKAWAPNRDDDQREREARRHLEKALYLCAETADLKSAPKRSR
jgi:hypothetical protein